MLVCRLRTSYERGGKFTRAGELGQTHRQNTIGNHVPIHTPNTEDNKEKLTTRLYRKQRDEYEVYDVVGST
jgi:hypothetical protein